MKLKIGVLLLSVTLVVLLILSLIKSDKEDYFKQVDLSYNNVIVNSLDRVHYYDTILSVGMDAAGLKGLTVVINDLSGASENQFSGELKAHIRLFNGVYYLFVGALDRVEAIQVIAHEVIHIQQYNSGELVYENGEIKWQNEVYSLEEDYEKRPWERDAFEKQAAIETFILNTLY